MNTINQLSQRAGCSGGRNRGCGCGCLGVILALLLMGYMVLRYFGGGIDISTINIPGFPTINQQEQEYDGGSNQNNNTNRSNRGGSGLDIDNPLQNGIPDNQPIESRDV
ncbi:MAG: hypothetical protein J5693_05280 [Bacteroidales bacterium]|nr:hypothetical protein [Bacteroidales bacterium]